MRRRSSTVRSAVQRNLPVELDTIKHGALNDARVVRRELVLDSREVGDGATQRDEHIGDGSAVERLEVVGDRPHRLSQDVAPRRHRRGRIAL